MSYFSIILIGIALAMDAFAVSLSKGICLNKIHLNFSFKIAILFGVFQGGMTILGWFVGSVLTNFFDKYGFVVVIILVGLGINMIVQAFKDEEKDLSSIFSMKSLLPLALATSLDALAVGVSLAFLHVHIVIAAIIIAIVTFIICLAGVILGTAIGSKINSTIAEALGGVILIILGIFELFK